MVNGDRLLIRLLHEKDLYLNLELSPSRLRDFKGWLVDHSHRRGIGLMELERDFLDEGRDVVGSPYLGQCIFAPLARRRRGSAPDSDSPAMCVVGVLALRREEVDGRVAVHYWPVDSDALRSNRRAVSFEQLFHLWLYRGTP